MFLAANSSYFSPRTTPRHLSRRTYLPAANKGFLSLFLPFLFLLFLYSFSFAHRLEARLPWRASYVRINRSTRAAPSFSVFTNSGREWGVGESSQPVRFPRDVELY